MKKIMIAPFIVFVILLFSGCNKKSEEVKSLTDNSASEIQAKLDEKQVKIDELIEAKKQEDAELNSIKSNQDITSCQKIQEDCKSKIYELENGELNIYSRGSKLKGDRTKMITQLEKDIDQAKRLRKDAEEHNQLSGVKQFQEDSDDAQRSLAQIKKIMADEKAQKEALLNGECKNYKNTCE